jgi:hypothetical protein
MSSSGLPPRADPQYIMRPENPHVPLVPNPMVLPALLPGGPPNIAGPFPLPPSSSKGTTSPSK